MLFNTDKKGLSNTSGLDPIRTTLIITFLQKNLAKIGPKLGQKWPFFAPKIPEFPNFQYGNSVLSSIPEYRNSVSVLEPL